MRKTLRSASGQHAALSGNLIAYSVEDGIAKIYLNNPPLNILNMNLMRELGDAVDRASHDASVRAILVGTRIEKAFSAGADVKEHLPDKAPYMLDEFKKLIEKILFNEKPTVAAVKGACLGGGFELAMAFDFVVAGNSAVLGTPEIMLSSMPPIAAILMPRISGIRGALRVVLLGENITAQDAAGMGMLTKVVPDNEVDAEALKIARSAAGLSLAAVKILKKVFWAGLVMDLSEGFQHANDTYVKELIKTQDGVEGLRAFLEKRKPVWSDR